MNRDWGAWADRRSWDSAGTWSKISNVRGEDMNSFSEDAYRERRMLSGLFAIFFSRNEEVKDVNI